MLDNFALLSGQINMLTRLIKSDRIPQLRGYVLLPLVLSPERDAELEVTHSSINCVHTHLFHEHRSAVATLDKTVSSKCLESV